MFLLQLSAKALDATIIIVDAGMNIVSPIKNPLKKAMSVAKIAMSVAAPHLFGGQTRFIALHDALLSKSQKIDEHFKVLLEADMNTAVDAYLRGIQVRRQSGNAEHGAWRIDFGFALERAQDGFSRVTNPEQKIKCYEIMCICFLALRSPQEAFASILHSTETILKDTYVNSSLSNLKKTIQRPRKTLNHADSILLSLLFDRVCGTVDVCSKDSGWTTENREAFRKLFRENKHLRKATHPELFPEWERLVAHDGSIFVWRTKCVNRVIQYRDILTDLAQSESTDTYLLGDINVVKKGKGGEKHEIVPKHTTKLTLLVNTMRTIAPFLIMAAVVALVVLTINVITNRRTHSCSCDQSGSISLLGADYFIPGSGLSLGPGSLDMDRYNKMIHQFIISIVAKSQRGIEIIKN